MGTYLRRTQRRRKDGSVVGYLQLAHNRRVEGVTHAEALLTLGREDELDVDGLRRVMPSIGRYLERVDGVGALEQDSGGELRATDARPIGAAWALDALWRRLGIDRALGQALASPECALFGSRNWCTIRFPLTLRNGLGVFSFRVPVVR